MENHTPNTPQPIYIDLRESSNAKAFKTKNRIHQLEFDRVCNWIDTHLERLDKYVEDFRSKGVFEERYLDTISILGSRGSGKTSFLLSLLDEYRNNEHTKVEILDVIDPTLIEEKGHIFLTIISAIREKVDKRFREISVNSTCSKQSLRESWEKKLHSLSHGLPSVDGVGGLAQESWQDADYIMNKGLKAVSSARALEKHFHEFVELSLCILGKKAFILLLDDIDIDFMTGMPVLETLRKYLTTPQIVTLVSGDITLFSKAIRKKQWKNFGKALLMNEAEKQGKMKEYNDLVTEMESQYLQKVLKPQRRIHLNTLLEKIESYKTVIAVEDPYNGSAPIRTYYARKLERFGIKNISQSKAYSTFLLSLPLRTQIQFLSQLLPESGGYHADITDAFLSDLNEKRVDIELAKNMPGMLNVVILKLLLDEKVLSESYQLQPITSDQSLNSSLLSLSLLFAEKVKENPYLIFDYFIKVGYVRNLLASLEYQQEKSEKSLGETMPSIEGLCQYGGLFQEKVLRDNTATMIAYLRGYLNSKTNGEQNLRSWAGSVPLRGLNAFAKGKNPEGRIDYVFGYEFSPETCLAYMPVSLCDYATKNATIVTYSIYTLLGAISDIIKEKDNLRENLMNLSQIRSFIMPDFKKSQFGTDEEEEATGEWAERQQEFELNVKEFEEKIREWINLFPTDGVSPHVLGKISTRFFYALENIEKNKAPHLAEQFHRQVVALLNAVVVEDVRENQERGPRRTTPYRTISDININNAITADSHFLRNLRVANEMKGDFSLSRWFLNCPLLLAYLRFDLILNMDQYQYVEWEISALDKFNIYNRLSEVCFALGKVETVNTSTNKDEELPRFCGSKDESYAVSTIQKLRELNIKCEEFLSFNFEDKNSRDEFRNRYQENFADSDINPRSLKALWKNVRLASTGKMNRKLYKTFIETVKEWNNKS